MHIGMILDKPFPPDPRVENEAVYLTKQGHQVTLFCLTYHKNHIGESDYKGFKVVRYLSNKWLYKFSALAYTLPMYRYGMGQLISEFIQAYKPAVLHVHDVQVMGAVEHANSSNIPVVLDLHENRPAIMPYYAHLKKGLGKAVISIAQWKKAEEKFVNTVCKTIVVTQEAKQELLTRTQVKKQNIHVVPNTVLQSFYENIQLNNTIVNKYKKHFAVLYIGDTALRRGLLTVINAIPTIVKSIPNFKLVIVGTSTEEVVLRKTVKDLDIEAFVDFEGWQDTSTFQSYITAASVCISPLHRNLHHDTTYANKIFQYASLGTPLLISDAIAQKNWVENYQVGLVHKAEDSIDFINKLLTMYVDNLLLAKMGANGKQIVREKYYWEQTAKNLDVLYNTIQK
ncbi:glycosyltransferase family 4 protein [Flavobacteriaceae bacterium]|nr:glycosyltransferase family 4 protein [Flavobacteriaceae bacterium]